ncbi:hypothetical protein EGW07_25610 [Citrobacter amalonaticus]|nr:hypothetical protein EGW07_25610 [Citrobacter amalonaticus]
MHIEWILTKRDQLDAKKPTGEVGFFTVPALSWCSDRSKTLNNQQFHDNADDTLCQKSEGLIYCCPLALFCLTPANRSAA